MLLYFIRIAGKSLWRNPFISLLTIAEIAFGIGLTMTTITLYRHMGKDPIPEKSNRLYAVQLDNWSEVKPARPPNEPPTQLTYRDSLELMKSPIPKHQSAMYRTRRFIHPPKDVARPFRVNIRVCYQDFFQLFEPPFQFGGPWDEAADESATPSCVISKKLNDRLFRGEESVGRTLRIADRDFRIVGVLDRWHPSPLFFDPFLDAFRDPEDIYVPFSFVRPMQLASSGSMDGWKGWDDSFEERLLSEKVWLQMWVELEPDQVSLYRDYLDRYAMEQKELGRFPRPLNNRLVGVNDWLEVNEVVDEKTTTMVLIAVCVMVICILNMVGLILGKFLGRMPEVGVRRAMGASKGSIFTQYLVEAGVLGWFGSLAGIPMTLWMLDIYRSWRGGAANLYQLDGGLLMLLVVMSLIVGLLAALYPAWRVCATSPVEHIKNQ